MIDISALSEAYRARRLSDADVDAVLALCEGNSQFYRYCAAEPTRGQVLSDMHITPPGIDEAHKYYVGFYRDDVLVAVMDLIDGYPDPKIAYIGFFMMDIRFQGRQLGSALIREVKDCLKRAGFSAVRLAIDKANPQSNHFWKKNGFEVIREVPRDEWTVLEAECTL